MILMTMVTLKTKVSMIELYVCHHQGEREQQQGEIEIAKEKAKQRIQFKIKVSASR